MKLWWRLLIVVFVAIAPVQAQQDGAILTEDVINASIDEVWNAWTTKDGIESWMVAKTEVDLKVGALWRTSYSPTSTLDDDASIHHLILAFDPGRMLSFRTIKPPRTFPWPNAILQTWTVVYLEPVAPSRTKVTIRMLGYGDDHDLRAMRAFFEKGNRITLDALKKRFGSA